MKNLPRLAFGLPLTLLFACATPPSGPLTVQSAAVSARPPNEAPPVRAPSITGTVRQRDGAPIRGGSWLVQRWGFKEPTAKGSFGEDGSFAVEVPTPGVYAFGISVPDHERVLVMVHVERAVRVDGSLAPRSVDSSFRVEGTDDTAVAVDAFVRRWESRLGALAGPDARTAAARMSGEAWAEVTRTNGDSALLRAAHFALFSSFDAGRRREDLTWLIEHIAPSEPRLALLRGLPDALSQATIGVDAALLQRAEAWQEALVATNRDDSLVSATLEALAARANERREDGRVTSLYDAATAPRFAGSFAAHRMAAKFDPHRPLQRGKPFPDFDLLALDGKTHITNASLAGRPFLIEFWSLTCAPCIRGMAKTHEAYEELNGARRSKEEGEAGLRHLRPVKSPKVAFVFVSSGDSATDITKFRKTQWAMPWAHATVTQGWDELGKRVGVTAVPTLVLVDAKGIVREVDGDLKGPKLADTIKSLIDGGAK